MNEQNGVRVRFAPSPTGYLHIGSLRAALFNWLFAKHNNGKFLIRIEDTDFERSKEEYVNSILNSLKWTSINSDEEIKFQSQCLDNYKIVVDSMVESGTAYRCFCTLSQLDQRLNIESENSDYKKYDQKCRSLKIEDQDLNLPYVIRFKLPEDISNISFYDLIREEVTFDIDQFDDFIIVRSDGIPTYNFAVVIDDHDSKITHVLRGEDHISNTPKQVMLYKALGFNLPEFGHFPLLLAPDGSKLSKRFAATSVDIYKQEGFLPNALCNYLIRLGWSHGDQEIFTTQELINYFDLANVGKKGSIFDIKKLEWVNSVYIKNSSNKDLLNYIQHNLDSNFTNNFCQWSVDTLLNVIELYKSRVKTLKELIEEVSLLYNKPSYEKIENLENLNIKQVIFNLNNLLSLLQELQLFDSSSIEISVKEMCKLYNIKIPEIAQPLRLALIGKISSPSVFALLEILQKDKSINRIKNFIDFLLLRVEKH